MAQLALSVVGAAIGSVVPGVGTSAGWLIGSLIGGALFAKGSKTEGPRLGDLTVQSSTEGAPIAIVYGNGRVAGMLFWSTGIQETKTKKKVGGKGLGGKSSNTTYTYRASFAVALADRSTTTPIQGIRKIWADGKLIYSASSTATAATIYSSRKKLASITMYSGSSTQAADPTIQALQGAADTPAFRYTAYIVFKGFQLADFANRVPNITAEVVTTGSGTAPYRVNTWAPLVNQENSVSRAGTIEFIEPASVDNGATITLTVSKKVYTINGVLASTSSEAKTFTDYGGTSYNWVSVTGAPNNILLDRSGAQDWYLGSELRGSVGRFGNTGFLSQQANTTGLVYLGGSIFAVQFGTTATLEGIVRFAVSENGIVERDANRLMQFVAGVHVTALQKSGSFTRLSAGDDGLLYLTCQDDGVGSIAAEIFSFDTELNEVARYNYPTSGSITGYSGYSGVAVNGTTLMDSHFSGSVRVRAWALTSPILTAIGEVVTTGAETKMVSVGGGLGLHESGIYSMYPPTDPGAVTLASVVTNLCLRCGLTAGQINVAALTDTVDFYAIGRHVAGRAGIEPLMQAYYFDAVESGGVIKFVKRGGASVATLTENDLGFGDGSSALVKTSRQQEYELPIQVNVQHMDINNDYQPGSQSSRRLTSPSKVIVDLDFPMGFSSTKAAQIAEVLQLNSWTERTRYELRATRKHAHLEPTDIITLPSGDLARIVVSDFSDSGTMRFDAVADAVAIYAPVAVGNDAGSNAPQDVPTDGPTLAFIMDLPALSVYENAPGIYLAAAGYFPGWSGAEILISTDGGTSYAGVYAVTNDAVIGYTTTALGGAVSPHQLDAYSVVTVQLLNGAYTLSSITDDQVLAGGNLCAIKSGRDWEILQFGVATLVSAGTYTLSRLLRGRFGTESWITGHGIGDAFVLITVDELNFIERPQADVGVARLLKASTFGDTYADTEALAFTNTGRSQQPLAPLHLNAGPNRITGNWDLSWTRRARLNFWWLDNSDVALDETTEAYRVEILDNLTGAVKRSIGATTAAATYSLANQVTDFAASISALNWRVCQSSALIGNGQFATEIVDPPMFGSHFNIVSSCLPALHVYSWTSTTIVDDQSVANIDTGAFVGTKTVNLTPTGILTDTTTRYVAFSAGGYATLPTSTRYNPVNALTFGVWARWTSATAANALGGMYGATNQFALYAGASGEVNFRITLGVSNVTITSGNGINNGAWRFVVGTAVKIYSSGIFTGYDMNLHIDGALVASFAGSNATEIATSTNPFGIGAFGNGTSPLNGDIGEVFLLSSTALSTAQILRLYNSAITG